MSKKKSKKQLAEIKYQVCLLRMGMEVQKEHMVHLAEAYAKQEDFSITISRIYDNFIEKLKEIENTK